MASAASSSSSSSSAFSTSSHSSSPSDVSARLGVLAATSGEMADAAHKAVALDGLLHRCLQGQRTREQAALLCTQLIHGDVVQPSLPATFRRWVQADTYAALRPALLDLLIALCQSPTTRDSLTPSHCQALMSLALFVVRSEAGSRVREKALELMDRLLAIHRIRWDAHTDDPEHITPTSIIDTYAHAAHTPVVHMRARTGAAGGHRVRSSAAALLLCVCQCVPGAGPQEVRAERDGARAAVLGAGGAVRALPRGNAAERCASGRDAVPGAAGGAGQQPRAVGAGAGRSPARSDRVPAPLQLRAHQTSAAATTLSTTAQPQRATRPDAVHRVHVWLLQRVV